MKTFYLCITYAFIVVFCHLADAPAAQTGGDPSPDGREPPVRNEYNNSNVYYGDVYNGDQNDGYNGFIGTWRDPETDDIITSVIAPRQPQQNQQSPPIYVYPGYEAYDDGGYGQHSGGQTRPQDRYGHGGDRREHRRHSAPNGILHGFDGKKHRFDGNNGWRHPHHLHRPNKWRRQLQCRPCSGILP